jgi:hypothetical protein
MQLPVASSDCQHLLSLFGGRCGKAGALNENAAANLDLDLVHSFPIRVSTSGSAILEPQAADEWTLRAGGSHATLALECVGRPATMTIDADERTDRVSLCPARGRVWFTLVARATPSGPGLLDFRDVRRIDGRYAPTRVDLKATALEYTVGDAAGSYADDAARTTSMAAADGSRLAVTLATSARDLNLSIRGEATTLRIGGAQRLRTRYARDAEIWLALIGLAVSLFAPVVLEWLRIRKD